MATTVGASQAANFIPEIWAARALEVLRANVAAAKLVLTDSEIDSSFKVGDTLNVPYVGTFTANDKSAGASVTLQAPTDGTIAVVLNKHKEVSFIVEDIAQAQANQSIMDRYVEAAVPALAEAIETAILAEYANAGGNVGTYGTSTTAANLLSIRQKLNDAKAPQTGRAVILSTKDEIALLTDSALASYFAYSKPETIASGAVGHVYGFDLYMSQLIPVTAGTPNQTNNLAFQRNGIILAMRGMPIPDGCRGAVVRDPVTGLAVRVISMYNPTYLGVQTTIDVLFGVKTARASHIVLAKS